MNAHVKKWITPRLIVLERGAPEENVLAACKGRGLQGSSRNSAGGCRKERHFLVPTATTPPIAKQFLRPALLTPKGRFKAHRRRHSESGAWLIPSL